MAVTAQELNAAAQRLLSAYATVTPKIDEALSLIQSLDPCSAGAKAALDKSKVVRDQGASIFNGEVKEALRAYNALYAQAEGEVKELGKSLNQQINGTQDPLVAKNGIVKEFQASFAEKIAKCPAATPPTTANNTPTTATTATANAAPTANAASGTNITGEADGDKKTGGNTTAPAPATVPTEKKSEDEKPGKRLFNPLGEFPTYTYNLSLYMITPKAYDAFTASGRTKLPTEGLAVVCQSGGVNNDVQMRGAGFTMDYYIDNLKIETFTSGMDTQTSTNTTNIEFQINEPYGFSFISNLQRCANDLIAKSKEQGLENLDNSTRQFFILGIRFTGFDVDGTPIKDKKTGMPLYERFYDIYISEMKFKLDNKATVYSIKAVSAAPGVAFGAKRGIWNTGGTLRGTTVYDMLKNMEDQLNKTAADSVKNTKIKPNTYKFKIVGEKIGDDEASQRAAPIFKERMISETDVTKQTLVGSKPNVTNGRAGQDQGLPDTTVGELAIANGTPILQAFESIISRSTYITSAFKTIQNNPLESNPQKANGEIEQTADNKNYVRWYNVSASVQNGQFFKEINDFTYDITYVFQVYETPVITNPYSNPGVPYYGPVKRYDYWFTGQNSEILGYTQNLDNTFFTVAVGGLNENQNTTTTPATPVATGAIPNAPKTDTTNVQDAGKRAYITSLFDPSSQANVSIKIMGDPDFLMPESTVPINKLYNRFYGTQDLTINPNGGQVFIEIDFKEPQDYDFRSTDGITYSSTGTGVMSVNDKIQFWNYPKKVANMVKGVSYRLIKVSSKFDKGVFEQDLQCVINTFPDVQDDTIDDLQEVTVSSQKKPVPGSSNVTGLKPDKLPTPGKGITSPSIDFLKQSKAAMQSADGDKDPFSLSNVTKTLNEKARFDPGAAPAIPGLTSGPPRGFGGG